jgi:uncharacterized OsmC-like protein
MMSDPARLKDLYERQRRALSRRPALGWSGGQARIRLVGLGGEAAHGGWRTPVVAPGGGEEADGLPTPDLLMRASIGACLALGYRLWGARLGVDIEDVAIDVVTVSDGRGPLDLGEGIPVGWQRVVFNSRVSSPAPERDVARVVETAHRLSPMLANLSPAVTRLLQLTVK